MDRADWYFILIISMILGSALWMIEQPQTLNFNGRPISRICR